MRRSLLLSLTFAVPAFAQSTSEIAGIPHVIGPTYRFADFDGDNLDDVYLVDPSGADWLFRNRGDGAFEDVTANNGLAGITGSRMAVWLDFDNDGAVDLYVASSQGQSKLFQNTGQGLFVDVTSVAGIAHEGPEWFVEALDYDGDALLDLHVVTERGDVLFHNLGRGRFERADLPRTDGLVTDLALPLDAPMDADAEADVDATPLDTAGDPVLRRRSSRARTNRAFQAWLATATPTSTSTTTSPSSGGGPSALIACRPGIQDIATMGCVDVSSTPTLGTLYPLSINLNVSAAGKVGVGTTSPNANLHVAGVDGLLATGTYAAGTLPASGAGVRMMWYPRKAAFRAGRALGQEWDDANIGDGSVALGLDTRASGPNSTAMGIYNHASGIESTAMGRETTASGSSSTAMGHGTIAGSYYGTAIGAYNVGGGSPGGWVLTDPLFEIGNGQFGVPSNAITVLKNGNTGVGTTNPQVKLSVVGSLNVDYGATNSGTTTNAIRFGDVSSAEAIGSKKTAGGNQNGLDFYTFGVNRMAIANGGNVGVGTTMPDSRMHVHTGSAGTVTAFTNTVLTIENSTNNFVSLLSPDANERGFLFGDPLSNVDGAFIYNSPSVPNGLDLRANGNVTRMAVNSSGNVGVGTTAPEARVHAHANSAGAVTANGFSVIVAENNAPCFLSLLTPDSEERGILFGEPFNSAAGGILYNNVANPDGLQLRTNGNTTRMVVDGVGNVGIGRTSTANRLEVEGEISKTTAGICAANSDRRIKTEIHELDNALETLDRIRPVAFHYTDAYMAEHPTIEDKEYFNVIAQEFAEVFPDYVHDSGENGILQVDTYPALIHTIAAVKELHALGKQKDAHIASLEERIARLENALAALATVRK